MNLYTKICDYAQSEKGSWLKDDFQWWTIKIKPLKFKLEGLITAMYLCFSDTIYVAADLDLDVFFGTVIHLLYHAKQRHDDGLLKYLFTKMFDRSTLEAEAKLALLNAVEWCGLQRILLMKRKRALKNG